MRWERRDPELQLEEKQDRYYMTIITTTQAAEILGCSPGTVGRMCQEGVLHAQRMSGMWAIDEAQCREYAKRYVNSKRPGRTNEYKPKPFHIKPENSIPDAPQHTPAEWKRVTRRAQLGAMIRQLEATR